MIGRRPWISVLMTGWVAVGGLGVVRAQDEVRGFSSRPILIAETEGHHAPVRGLVWQDADTLLSGGEDKVVKVWDLREGARPNRTIRPVIWRGPRGAIYAMALTARPDAQGQSLLAVGGYGVESSGGDLTIFRVPGLTRNPTGDLVKRLVRPPGNVGQAIAHGQSVTALAFNPAGTVLASGSNDRTVILWDVTRDFAPIRVLRDHQAPVRSLAFSPDGSRLVSGAADGQIVLWDVARGQAADSLASRVPVNVVAYSPDGRSIVAGAENGALIRLGATRLGENAARLRAPDRKPIETLAYRPDGRFLAVSVMSDQVNVPDPMTIACDVELRTMPDGNVSRRWPRVHGLVRAMSFSPDGARLAYSGGAAQSLYLQDMAAPEAPPRELRGKGSTPFDLGFTRDSRAIGFARQPFAAASPPRSYEGFDMARRAAVTLSRGQLAGAVSAHEGWTFPRTVNPTELEAVNADGRRSRFAIDPRTELHRWSWTFVPPGPGHPRATVAIGTDSGITVFDLETGRRTRAYGGPSAPVVSVVPSPDGRWLAGASQDQAIRIYPLAGCDAIPTFGATFRRRADGAWAVADVRRRSVAASIGLSRGDVVVMAGIGTELMRNPDEIARFIERVDGEPPGLNQVGLRVRRVVPIPGLGAIPAVLTLATTAKADNPMLTLLMDADREWVVWTPQGYYDTSIDGDTRLLGWHTNAPYREPRPTDFVPIVTYSAAMNRPDVLERLWLTGDLDQALAAVPRREPAPEVRAAASQPPRIIFASAAGGERLPAPGVLWRASVRRPRLSVKIAAEPGKPAVRDRRVIFDERPRPMAPLAAPVDNLSEDIELDLPPNRRVRLAVEAVGADDSRRVESIDAIYVQPPEPPPPPPRLFILAIGTDQFEDQQLPPVPFAVEDAQDLAGFLAGHLVSTDSARIQQHEDRLLTGTRASARSITEALDWLNDLVRKQRVNKGDVVAVVIASHVLDLKGSMALATADSRVGPAPGGVIPTRDLCDVLGHLTDYGCRAIVFLDGIHKVEVPLAVRIKPMVRELYQKRGVITFVASKEGPSNIDSNAGHGTFALGLLRVFQGAGGGGNREDAYSLDQFRTALRDAVLNLSEWQQEAACYIPLRVPEQTSFARP